MKKIKLLLLILLISLLAVMLSPFVTAFYNITNLAFNESFNYTDKYTDNGWSWHCPISPSVSENPVNSVFTDYAFGNNGTGSGAFGFCVIYRNLPTSIDNDKNVFISFNMSFSSTDSSQYQFVLYIGSENNIAASPSIQISLFDILSGKDEILISKGSAPFTNFQNSICDVSDYITRGEYTNAVVEVVLNFDFTSMIYYVYVNETSLNCSGSSMGVLTDEDWQINSIALYTTYYQTGFGYVNSTLDDFKIGEGSFTEPPVYTCPYPILFCDNFNYAESLITRDWLVQIGGGNINYTFAPIDNILNLQGSTNIFPYHETNAFDVTYRTEEGKWTQNIYSPVFSSEFDLTLYNVSDGGFKYSASEKQYISGYYIKAEVSTENGTFNSSGNVNWYYANRTQEPITLEWILLCGNCTIADNTTEYTIKINSFFAQRDEFPFNSSIDDDEINIYANSILLGTIEDYLDSRITYLMQYEIIKESDYKFDVDDYYVMVGTDRITYTGEQYYTDLFINITEPEIILGTGEEGDMATYLGQIWYDFGLRSLASRMMAGMFLMFLLAIVMFGAALSMHAHLSAVVLIIVELFFMILLTYIKLLPIWLPFVIIIIGAGIGAIVFKMGSTGGGY